MSVESPAFPTFLVALHRFIADNGAAWDFDFLFPGDATWMPHDEVFGTLTSGVRAPGPSHRDAATHFLAFANDNVGNIFALYRQDGAKAVESCPVVFFGVDGVVAVLGSDLSQFATLLANNVDISCRGAHFADDVNEQAGSEIAKLESEIDSSLVQFLKEQFATVDSELSDEQLQTLIDKGYASFGGEHSFHEIMTIACGDDRDEE
jgi:hypothetical protein